MTCPKHFKIATHFGTDPSNFQYIRGKGWHYRGHFIGRSFSDVQSSTYWALKKLPGRNTF